MGKTSFITYYSAYLSQKIRDKQPIDRFAIKISLTNLLAQGVEKTINSTVAQKTRLNIDLFWKLVRKGKIVFLLDGFDEMGFLPDAQARFREFDTLWKRLATQGNKVVITGRPEYFPALRTEQHALSTATHSQKPYTEKVGLELLADESILAYLQQWYADMGKTYFKWIKSNASLYDLVRRPYLCFIITQELHKLYTQSNSAEEWNAGKLMQSYMNTWIERQISKDIYTALPLEESKKKELVWSFFRDLAADLYIKDTLQISATDLQARLQAFVSKNFPKTSPQVRQTLVHELQTGYFLQRTDDSWGFVHKSFYEYLVAEKIIQTISTHKSIGKLGNTKKLSQGAIINFLKDAIPKEYKLNRKNPSILLYLFNDKILNFLFNSFIGKYDKFIINMIFFWKTIFLLSAFIVTIEKNGIYREYHLKNVLKYFSLPTLWLITMLWFMWMFFSIFLYRNKIIFIQKNEINLPKIQRTNSLMQAIFWLLSIK